MNRFRRSLRQPAAGPSPDDAWDLGAVLAYVTRDKVLIVAVGLLLTYVWRFHELSDVLLPLRLAAIFSVLSWIMLVSPRILGSVGQGVGRPHVIAFLALNVWIIIGMPFGMDGERTWDFFLHFQFKNVLFLLFLLGAVSSARALYLLVVVMSFGAAVASFYYIKGGLSPWSPLPFYDINDVALLLNMSWPFAVWMAMSAPRKAVRMGSWLVVLMAIVSVIGTGSRGGFLAMTVALVVFLGRSKAFRLRQKVAVAGVVAVMLALAPDAFWERMGTILNPSEDYNVTSDTGRIAVWERGMGYFWSSPVTGIGADNFPLAEGTLRTEARAGMVVKWSAAHNSYLQVLVETGFVGFMLWFASIILCFAALERVRRKLRGDPRPEPRRIHRLAETTQVSLIAYGVGATFLSQAFLAYLLVLFCVCSAIQAAAARFGPPPLPSRPSNPGRPSRAGGPRRVRPQLAPRS